MKFIQKIWEMEFTHVSELEQKSFMNMMTGEVDEMYLKWNEWDIATNNY